MYSHRKYSKIWQPVKRESYKNGIEMVPFLLYPKERNLMAYILKYKYWLFLVFLPGESQGQGSLVGCRLWGRTESDTTEVT